MNEPLGFRDARLLEAVRNDFAIFVRLSRDTNFKAIDLQAAVGPYMLLKEGVSSSAGRELLKNMLNSEL
ncbi:MAG: hypothetical protein IH951_13780, partial [Bacteroidetes bacterium]|nr:hypothetical protein [Bacteroidota bacterium]